MKWNPPLWARVLLAAVLALILWDQYRRGQSVMPLVTALTISAAYRLLTRKKTDA